MASSCSLKPSGLIPVWQYSISSLSFFFFLFLFCSSSLFQKGITIYNLILNTGLVNASITHTTNELVKVWAVRDGSSNEYVFLHFYPSFIVSFIFPLIFVFISLANYCNRIRVVVVHKDIVTKESANVTISLAGGTFSSIGYLLRVLAPSPYSTVTSSVLFPFILPC